MNLPVFIAKRYLFSKRKKNFINIISIISIVVVAIITASLIIVLSVFNGLEDLLRSLNNSFDPEIKIEASQGKSFTLSQELLKKINTIPGIEVVTEVIEDYAYVRYRDANQVVILKGVSENFIDQHRIDYSIIEGDLALRKNNINYAILGVGVKNALNVNIGDNMHGMQIYYVKNTKAGSSNPYSQRTIIPRAVFSIVQNLDESYVLVPLDFAKELLNYGDKRTSLEIKTKPNFKISQVQSSLKQLLGTQFSVLNPEEQHQDLYKLLKMEKLFAFLALTLLLCVGSINIFFTLMMLALDKKKDVSILSAMGAHTKTIQRVFLIEGALIALIGTVIGLMIGGSLCWAQDHFAIVSMGMETSVTEGYPVKMAATDFVYVLIAMFLITFLISYRPATLAGRFASVHNL